MILRIVKMNVNSSHVDDFASVFQSVKPRILTQEGCLSVRLFHDAESPNVIFTVSRWTSVEALDAYRSTSFFQDTWMKVKVFFDGPTQVWSLLEFEETS